MSDVLVIHLGLHSHQCQAFVSFPFFISAVRSCRCSVSTLPLSCIFCPTARCFVSVSLVQRILAVEPIASRQVLQASLFEVLSKWPCAGLQLQSSCLCLPIMWGYHAHAQLPNILNAKLLSFQTLAPVLMVSRKQNFSILRAASTHLGQFLFSRCLLALCGG